jgi:sarcosine oxidase subunit delta
MKLLNCPMHGVRPLNEFLFGGEFREMPNPDTSSDLEWASYVHYRDNAPGIKKEWWYHTPSGTWFIAERNTMTDEVLATYLYGKAPLANSTASSDKKEQSV